MTTLVSFPPEVVQEALRTALKGHPPTDEQRIVIESPLEHGVVNAGAGSGKTAVMTARLVHLVATGQVSPAKILGLTFTNKAAEELRSRVRDALRLLGLPLGDHPTVMTYHAFAGTFIADHGMRAGYEPNSALMTDAHVFQLMWEAMGSMSFQHLEVRTTYPAGQARDLADDCANHLVDLDRLIDHDTAMARRLDGGKGWARRDARATSLRRTDLARAVRQFEDLKRARHRIDFGDQIRVAYELAQHPEVRASFRERFDVVLLDEYQDTNIAQAAMLRAIVSGDEGPVVTAVGDPSQNIYAWRGANIRNILRFPEEFPNAGRPATRFPLATNFRSATRIIEVANAALTGATEPGEPVVPLVARVGAPEGVVEAHLLSDQEAEATLIADRVQAVIAEGTPPGEVAILARKRRLFGPVLRVLRERDVPVEVVGLGGLLEAPEVMDVLSMLRAITDPFDNVSLARVLMGPRWRVSPLDLALLARDFLERDRARREEDPDAPRSRYSLAEQIEHVEDATAVGAEAVRRLVRFRDGFRALKRLQHLPVDDLIERTIDTLGIRSEIEASPTKTAPFVARNLANLVQLAAGFAPVNGDVSLASFLAWIAAVPAANEPIAIAQPSEADAVKLMTIHSAKGLEFDVVVLCGLAGDTDARSKIFPDTTGQPNPSFRPQFVPVALRGDRDTFPEDADDFDVLKRALEERALREEHRLLYVAITRAKQQLIATAAHWYYPSDSFAESLKTSHGPSRFFDLIVQHPATSVRAVIERPEANPLTSIRDERAAIWPPPARVERDGFPDGIAAAVRAARAEASEDPSLFPTGAEAAPVAPQAISATGFVTYAACPKRFFWSYIRPLPRRSNPKARLGTAVHDWIAGQLDPQLSLLEPDEADRYAAAPGDAAVRLRNAYRGSRFADRIPRYVEHPFAITVDGVLLQGRIDAVFEDPDGSLEIVDWKTGRAPDDPRAEDHQMFVYAHAIVRLLGVPMARVQGTFVYLGGDEVVERTVTLGGEAEVEGRLVEIISAIRAGSFEPSPSDRCGGCDFLHFCEDGGRHVAGS